MARMHPSPPDNLGSPPVLRNVCMAITDRTYIAGYVVISQPLVALTHKHTPWEWTNEHEAAFRHIQNMLLSDKVLMYPRVNQPY